MPKLVALNTAILTCLTQFSRGYFFLPFFKNRSHCQRAEQQPSAFCESIATAMISRTDSEIEYDVGPGDLDFNSPDVQADLNRIDPPDSAPPATVSQLRTSSTPTPLNVGDGGNQISGAPIPAANDLDVGTQQALITSLLSNPNVVNNPTLFATVLTSLLGNGSSVDPELLALVTQPSRAADSAADLVPPVAVAEPTEENFDEAQPVASSPATDSASPLVPPVAVVESTEAEFDEVQPAPTSANAPPSTPIRQRSPSVMIGEVEDDDIPRLKLLSLKRSPSVTIEEVEDADAPKLKLLSPKPSPKPTVSSSQTIDESPSEHSDALQQLYKDVNTLFGDLGRTLKIDPSVLIEKYVKRFNLGREQSLWNLYESYASAAENAMSELSRLKDTENHGVYEQFASQHEKDPKLKATVDQVRLVYPLFRKEHSDAKGRDLLLAWQSLEALDSVSGYQQKVDRRRVWEHHSRQLTEHFDMLRNVYQMHFFALGVGGQVNTDNGLHWAYTNYKSEGFAESSFLKSIEKLIAAYRTHVFHLTMKEFTDQELIDIAEAQGLTVSRDDRVPPSAQKDFTDQELISIAEARGLTLIRDDRVPPMPPSMTKATSSVNAPKPTNFKASKTVRIADPETASDNESSIQRLILGIAEECNVKFRRVGLPWNSLARDCYNQGIQIINFLLGVTLPWNMPEDAKTRWKGVKSLEKTEQFRLIESCNPGEHCLSFKQLTPAEIQANIEPIAILAPDANGHREHIIAKSIGELATLQSMTVKTEEQDSSMAEVGSDHPTSNETVRPRRTKTVQFPAPSSVAGSDDDIDELSHHSDTDDDIYGIKNLPDDDDEYSSSPSKVKRKRKNHKSTALEKGKGKAMKDPELTPKAQGSRTLQTTPTGSSILYSLPRYYPNTSSQPRRGSLPRTLPQPAAQSDPKTAQPTPAHWPKALPRLGVSQVKNARNTTTPAILAPTDFDFQPVFSKPPSTAVNEPRPLPRTPSLVSTSAHASSMAQSAASTVPSLTSTEPSLTIPRSTVGAAPSVAGASRNSGSATPSVGGAPCNSGSATARPRRVQASATPTVPPPQAQPSLPRASVPPPSTQPAVLNSAALQALSTNPMLLSTLLTVLQAQNGRLQGGTEGLFVAAQGGSHPTQDSEMSDAQDEH
ncbi:hypothetical protein PM082_012104 [Marasmius tenuissimus]|nr:hypothetical protein PM082_012104 [Marasmius tenuissimus]